MTRKAVIGFVAALIMVGLVPSAQARDVPTRKATAEQVARSETAALQARTKRSLPPGAECVARRSRHRMRGWTGRRHLWDVTILCWIPNPWSNTTADGYGRLKVWTDSKKGLRVRISRIDWLRLRGSTRTTNQQGGM